MLFPINLARPARLAGLAWGAELAGRANVVQAAHAHARCEGDGGLPHGLLVAGWAQDHLLAILPEAALRRCSGIRPAAGHTRPGPLMGSPTHTLNTQK